MITPIDIYAATSVEHIHSMVESAARDRGYELDPKESYSAQAERLVVEAPSAGSWSEMMYELAELLVVADTVAQSMERHQVRAA